jgi:hypothetical protein
MDVVRLLLVFLHLVLVIHRACQNPTSKTTSSGNTVPYSETKPSTLQSK